VYCGVPRLLLGRQCPLRTRDYANIHTYIHLKKVCLRVERPDTRHLREAAKPLPVRIALPQSWALHLRWGRRAAECSGTAKKTGRIARLVCTAETAHRAHGAQSESTTQASTTKVRTPTAGFCALLQEKTRKQTKSRMEAGRAAEAAHRAQCAGVWGLLGHQPSGLLPGFLVVWTGMRPLMPWCCLFCHQVGR
jgi:hypothetical protein